MLRGKWALGPLLAAAAGILAAQDGSQRLVVLAEILGNSSTASVDDRLRAIAEIVEMRTTSGLAAGLIFDRANIQYEPSPLVREAAALAVRHVCAPRNRMFSLRLCRVASAAREPDPRVRIAALRSLAAFETSDAAAAVYDATDEAREPDPKVREVAHALIQKGLAASRY